VVTKLAAIGTVLKPGDTAFSIDGRPTVIMSGAVPAWRTIDIDSTSGIDILQLEQSLAAAGFDADGDLTVDREVDADTITAIKEWQASLDVEQTGVVALGEVIFQTTEVTVVASNSHVGAVATPGDTLLDVRSGTPYVDISTDSSWVQPGSKVTVSINGTRVQGTVVTLSSGIARVALEPSDAIRDGASARVTLSRTKATQQLLIPSSAILVSDVDGPTIRVKRGNSTETIRVTVVGSANSLAAVTTSDNTLKTGDNVATY
jgi:peptidoglycan hydrolase-like protein with peptidoglycan-binding domain